MTHKALKKMNSINYDKAYDSHVHFFGVGLSATDWIVQSNNLKLPLHLKERSFVKGFGLNPDVSEKALESLQKEHPNKEFCLSYTDGHSSLVSKNLLKKYDFTSNSNESKEHKDFVSLYESERDRFLKCLPKRSFDDLRLMALKSFEYFEAKAVRKVRHMTCTKIQWDVLKELYSKNSKSHPSPKLKINCYFAEFMEQSLNEAYEAYSYALNNPIETGTPLIEASGASKLKASGVSKLKASGLKLFVDGSFGQNTAYVSCFEDSRPRIDYEALKERMSDILINKKIPLALHCIGDLALEMSLKIYSELFDLDQKLAELHIEHAPIFTKKSLSILDSKDLKITFHFQPSHWIKDQHWYKKNKTKLKDHSIYPFNELNKLGYKFYMGSDAPVEESSNDKTKEGLEFIFKDQS